MNKKTKTSLISATCLVVIGCIIFAGVMSVLKWDFSKLSTVKYETNSYEITDNFKDISIISNTTDITLIPSEDEAISVVCREESKVKHLVEVKDNTLNIKVEDTRKWYEHIGLSFEIPKITVSIPKGEYGDLSIKNSTGGIAVNNLSANSLNITNTTGKISLKGIDCQGDISVTVSTGKSELENVKCNNLTSNGTTGNATLKDVIAKGKFNIERSTGDVSFTKCDASEILIKTSTGNVKGSLLSDKVFIAKSSTGKIDVPRSTSGGICEVSTSTGNINITVE